MKIIEEALKQSKLHKSQLAKLLGISRARVSQMLAMQERLTLKSIIDFCHCCGFSVDFKLAAQKPEKVSNEIPLALKWLFWDTDFSRLDPLLHKDYILSRILDRGNMEAVQWMQDQYSKRRILTHIEKYKLKMAAKSINYWAFIYNKEEKWQRPSTPGSANSWQRLPAVNA